MTPLEIAKAVGRWEKIRASAYEDLPWVAKGFDTKLDDAIDLCVESDKALEEAIRIAANNRMALVRLLDCPPAMHRETVDFFYPPSSGRKTANAVT